MAADPKSFDFFRRGQPLVVLWGGSPFDYYRRAQPIIGWISVGLTKDLSDTITLVDANTKAIGLNKSDSVTLTDVIVKAIAIVEADSVTLTDGIIKTVGLTLSDVITLSDAIAHSYGLSEADSITLSDVIIKTIGLNESDTVTLDDLFSAASQLILGLNDFVTLTDESVEVLIPVPTPTTDDADGFRRKRHIVEREDRRLKRLREDDEILMQTVAKFVINLN